MVFDKGQVARRRGDVRGQGQVRLENGQMHHRVSLRPEPRLLRKLFLPASKYIRQRRNSPTAGPTWNTHNSQDVRNVKVNVPGRLYR